MAVVKGGFEIRNYMKKEPFCSFLPGIAGEMGIPLWCFYVNRGQGICSFGVENKAGAIMEFYPAHQAYRNTPMTGYRTFMKVNGAYAEPFSCPDQEHTMVSGMNELLLTCRDEGKGIETRVTYFVLPGERLAALVRKVEITNLGQSAADIQLLDGVPELLPYGLNMHSIKVMTQTAQAWMQAENTDEPVVFFKVRASMEDSSDVTEVTGVRYAAACTADGRALRVLCEPRHVFGYRSDLAVPAGFMEKDWDAFLAEAECTQNMLPAAFAADRFTLQPGETHTHYMLIGEAESKARARAMCAKLLVPGALEAKHRDAVQLTDTLTARIDTVTGNPVFDAYCRQTYLDNLLRGGMPCTLPGGKLTYLYSRKHGDPERDYNEFRVRAEYYSQGNGNFRDVNQNRRCDVMFDPATGDRNVHQFFDLLQADGYNPLVVECIAFRLKEESRDAMLALVPEESKKWAHMLFAAPFTPGELRMRAEDWLPDAAAAEVFFARVLENSEQTVSAAFGEGYWSDHWTYNLDQIESYTSVFPDLEKDLLYADDSYTWYYSGMCILPRAKRYRETARGLRQYNYLYSVQNPFSLPCLTDAEGHVMHANLMEKLVSLAAVKAATPDMDGIGIEMEGGKPGWYDALNGLPGLMGSSVAEMAETARLIRYILEKTEAYAMPVSLMREVSDLLQGAGRIYMQEKDAFTRWQCLSDLREQYRSRIEKCVLGEKVTLSADEVKQLFTAMLAVIESGLERGRVENGGLYPTYFAYAAEEYEHTAEGIRITRARRIKMPDFLEGQVRALRLPYPRQHKEALADAVYQSLLYDRKLDMYKVNADLASASFEIGRAHAFTPGWLENESIWLHMEYKYLLEELRSGLYKRFSRDMETQLVPFLSEDVYGRSLLENSSFIASSANPDAAIHGKGFVARLSGSTAEFLSMWQLMLHGSTLFTMENGTLTFRLSPMLPAALTRGTTTVKAALFLNTTIIYTVEAGRAYYPGEYSLSGYTVRWQDGTAQTFASAICGEAAQRIRRGEAATIEVTLS